MGHSVSAASEYRLIHAIIGTRKRSGKDFETLYLLTLKNSYADIRFSVTDEKLIWKVLEESYVKVWEKAEEIPDQPQFRAWMRGQLCEAYRENAESELTAFPDVDNSSAANPADSTPAPMEPDSTPPPTAPGSTPAPMQPDQQRASGTLLSLEERLGIFDAFIDDDYTTTKYAYESQESRKRNKGKNTRTTTKAILGSLAAVALILGAVAAVSSISDTVKNRARFEMRDLDSVIATVVNTESETLAADHNAMQKNYGWKGEGRTRSYTDAQGVQVKEAWVPDGTRLYYLNRDGLIEAGDAKHQFEKDGKVFTLYENAVARVSNAAIQIYGSTFRLTRGEISNRLYCDGETLLEEGAAITGICGIDKKVYYCVINQVEDNTAVSQLRCFDMDTGKSITISAEFKGFVRDMFYDDKTSRIYMAYCEGTAKTNFEQLAFINLDNKFVYVVTEDQGVLAERKQNDTGLKIVGGDEETVYCIKYKPTEELKEIKERLENGEEEPAPDAAAECVAIPVSKRKRIA